MKKDTTKIMLQNRIAKIGLATSVLSLFLLAIGYINIDFCWPVTAIIVGILCGYYLITKFRKPPTRSQKFFWWLIALIAGYVLTGLLVFATFVAGFAHHWLYYPLLSLVIIIPIATLIYSAYLFIFLIKPSARPIKPHASNIYD